LTELQRAADLANRANLLLCDRSSGSSVLSTVQTTLNKHGGSPPSGKLWLKIQSYMEKEHSSEVTVPFFNAALAKVWRLEDAAFTLRSLTNQNLIELK